MRFLKHILVAAAALILFIRHVVNRKKRDMLPSSHPGTAEARCRVFVAHVL